MLPVRRPASPARDAERMERLAFLLALDAVGDVLGQRGAVLEAVPRAASDEPPAIALGMAVDDEVRVGREVVLANAAAEHRGARE